MYGAILIPLSHAFLQSKAAASITPGLEVFVHEVMAAITTEPCLSSNYLPLYSNFETVETSSYFKPNPLNPT